jgi:hypothetical protein
VSGCQNLFCFSFSPTFSFQRATRQYARRKSLQGFFDNFFWKSFNQNRPILPFKWRNALQAGHTLAFPRRFKTLNHIRKIRQFWIYLGLLCPLVILWGVSVFAQAPLPPALETFSASPALVPAPLSQPLPVPIGASRQVNVNAAGANITGDAANEPSLCMDPTKPEHIAVGWRQFNRVTNDFRQAGFAYSTNGGSTWSALRLLQTNVLRSDPVLAADASGRFYYLSLQPFPFRCDVWRSANGGASWQRLGPAFGGDKPWMTIDTTTGPGRGYIYQAWSPVDNTTANRVFTRSTDGGLTWMDPITIPQTPFWGTLDVGPRGEVYVVGWNGAAFWVNRSTNAPNRVVPFRFDLTRQINLGGSFVGPGSSTVNPEGLVGQPWIVVDKSGGPTRGNVYVLCSVADTINPGNPADVMFTRSTNGGINWSAPRRINDDPRNRNAWHWFGTLSVAPNGRIDACWNDTRGQTNLSLSALYYSSSSDGGVTWSTNRSVSPLFNHTLGYPTQRKMGDYIGMVSLSDAACIAYTATFNGEQDIYFLRLQRPVIISIVKVANRVTLTWKTMPGRTYCLQFNDRLNAPWSTASTIGCVVAEGPTATLQDSSVSGIAQRFYRVVEQP